MIKLIGLWLVGCALCGTPVAADEDLYDGPTAIKPLTMTPQPQHSAPPNMVCDFEHQCYPEKGDRRARLPRLPRPWLPSRLRPVPKSPRNPSSRRGETAWTGPCRATSSRTTSTAFRRRRGAVRCGWRSRVARTTPGQNLRPRWRYLRGWVGDATSVAAGGPSAAIRTATVRRVVAASDASDDRNRGTPPNCELHGPRFASAA